MYTQFLSLPFALIPMSDKVLCLRLSLCVCVMQSAVRNERIYKIFENSIQTATITRSNLECTIDVYLCTQHSTTTFSLTKHSIRTFKSVESVFKLVNITPSPHFTRLSSHVSCVLVLCCVVFSSLTLNVTNSLTHPSTFSHFVFSFFACRVFIVFVCVCARVFFTLYQHTHSLHYIKLM